MFFMNFNKILILTSLLILIIINLIEAQKRGIIKFTPPAASVDEVDFYDLSAVGDNTPKNNKIRSVENINNKSAKPARPVLPRATSRFRSTESLKNVIPSAQPPPPHYSNRNVTNGRTKALRRQDSVQLEISTVQSRLRKNNSRKGDDIEVQSIVNITPATKKSRINSKGTTEKQTRRKSIEISSTQATSRAKESRRGRSRVTVQKQKTNNSEKNQSTEAEKVVATTTKTSWRDSPANRRVPGSPVKLHNPNPADLDQLEDENYPEHFKLLLKAKYEEATSEASTRKIDVPKPEIPQISTTKHVPIVLQTSTTTNRATIAPKPKQIVRHQVKVKSKTESSELLQKSTTKKPDTPNPKLKFKPARSNRKLQLPSSLRHQTALANESKETNILPENELKSKNSDTFQRRSGRFSAKITTESSNLPIIRERSLIPNSMELNKLKNSFKAYPQNQKYSSRFRGDTFRGQGKTEKSKPIYTPTVPPMTTESEYKNHQSTSSEINQIAAGVNQMADGIPIIEIPGAWNMIETVPDGLMRNQFLLDIDSSSDNDDDGLLKLDDDEILAPSAAGSATVSIFEALSEVLSKTTATTTTTSTTTSTTTELPVIIKVPISNRMDTNLNGRNDLSSLNPLIPNPEIPEIIPPNSKNYLDQNVTTTETSYTDELKLVTEPLTDFIFNTTTPAFNKTNASTTNYNRKSKFLMLESNAHFLNSNNQLINNNINISLKSLDLIQSTQITTMPSNLPTSIPQPNILTTPGSDLISEPKLLQTINNYLDTSVQNVTNIAIDNITLQQQNNIPNAFHKLHSKPILLGSTPTTSRPIQTISFLDLFTIKPKRITVGPTEQSTIEVHPVYVEPDQVTISFITTESTFNPFEQIDRMNKSLKNSNNTNTQKIMVENSKNEKLPNILDFSTLENEIDSTTLQQIDITANNFENLAHKHVGLSSTQNSFEEEEQTTYSKQNLDNTLQTISNFTTPKSHSSTLIHEYSSTKPFTVTDFFHPTAITSTIHNMNLNSVDLTSTSEIPSTTEIPMTTMINTNSIQNKTDSIMTNGNITSTYRPRFQNRPTIKASITSMSLSTTETFEEEQSVKLTTSTPITTITSTATSSNTESSIDTTTDEPTKDDGNVQTVPTHDYHIYGILPNKTVVRKTPPKPEARGIAYAILSNQTVVRKYPNGTLVPYNYLEEENVEIIDVDPSMVFNPYSDLWRTTQRSIKRKSSIMKKTKYIGRTKYPYDHNNSFINYNNSNFVDKINNKFVNNSNLLYNSTDDIKFLGDSNSNNNNNSNHLSFFKQNIRNLTVILNNNINDNSVNNNLLSDVLTTNLSSSTSFEFNTENPVLYDILQRKYLNNSDINLKSNVVFSLTTSRSLVDEKTMTPPPQSENKYKIIELKNSIPLERDNEDDTSLNNSNEIREFELDDPLTLSEEEDSNDESTPIVFNPILFSSVPQRTTSTTTTRIPPTKSQTDRKQHYNENTIPDTDDSSYKKAKGSTKVNIVLPDEISTISSTFKTTSIAPISTSQKITPEPSTSSTTERSTTTSTTTERSTTTSTTERSTTTSTSERSTTTSTKSPAVVVISSTQNPSITTRKTKILSSTSSKAPSSINNALSLTTNNNERNLERNIRLLQELLGLQANLARRAQQITTVQPSTTTTTTTTTTTPKPTSTSTERITTTPSTTTTKITTRPTTTSAPSTTHNAQRSYQMSSTTQDSVVKPKPSDQDDLRFLATLRQALFGQQTSRKPLSTTKPTTTTTTTTTSTTPRTTTTTTTEETTLIPFRPIQTNNIDELLNSFQLGSSRILSTRKPGTSEDDIAFLNSLRKLARINDGTTNIPPTFSNRIVELALQARNSIQSQITTKPTTSTSTTTTTTTTKRPIKNDSHKKDLNSLNNDLSLLSTLLGRKISITDIPNLRNEILNSRKGKVTTTRKPQTTTPVNKDRVSEIEQNLRLLSSLLGRQVTISELPLIMSELRGSRRPKATISTSSTTPSTTTTTSTTTRKPTTTKIRPTLPEKKSQLTHEELLHLLKDDIGGNKDDFEIYGKSNEALLAAVLKQRGIGPVHNNVPSPNDLFIQDPQPTPFTTRSPRNQRPEIVQPSRRPLVEGLSWLWKTWQDTAPQTRKQRGGNKSATEHSITIDEIGPATSDGTVNPASMGAGAEDFAELPLSPPENGPAGNLFTAAIGVTRAVTSFLGAALQGAAKSVQGAWSNNADYYTLSGKR